MLRNFLGATAVVAALSLASPAGPAPAATAQQSDPDPLMGLAVHPEWGSVTAQDAVLRGGCRGGYTFSYTIAPPEGTWLLEVFVSGPGFKHLAAGAFLDNYDPKTGSGEYKLC